MSILKPFKILSDLENGRSEVKKMGIIDGIIALISYVLILMFPLGIGFTVVASPNNIILQLPLSIFALAVIFFIVILLFNECCITDPSKDKIKARTIKKFTLINTLLLILTILGYLLFFDSLLMPIDKILPGFDSIMEGINLVNESPVFFIGYFFIIGPILTEFVFRGVIVSGLSKKYSSLKAILISSLLYAISSFNPAGFMCAFIIGILLGYIYMKTYSLYLCIIGDILYNVITIVLLQYYPHFLLLMSSNISIIILLTGIGLLMMYFSIKKLSSYRLCHD